MPKPQLRLRLQDVPRDTETWESHDARHPVLWNDCARCLWRKHGGGFQAATVLKDEVTKKCYSPIVENPILDNGWSIGCSICSAYKDALKECQKPEDGEGRANAFADFRVYKVNMMQRSVLVRHVKNCCFHLKAVVYFNTIGALPSLASIDEKPRADVGVTTGLAGVPRPERFAWAFMICDRNCSMRDFEGFARMHDLTTNLTVEGVMTDS